MLVFLSTILFSCLDETIFIDDSQNFSQITENGTIINGRFFFTSKASLEKQIQKFEKEDISIVENKFERFYKNGFRSHNPIVNPENKLLLTTFAKEKAYIRSLSKNKYKSTENEEDEDGFISDPFFGAVVNQNNEIIVGDTLYKYTKDKGLFFSHIKDSSLLFNYFNSEIANKKLNYKTASVVDDPCEERELYGGTTQVDEKVYRYVAPIDEEGCNTGGGSGGGSTIPVVTAEENINTIINNLPTCVGEPGSFFKDLFGKSYYCRGYWTDTRRIHTEFWSKNWKVYTSTGIMVKTQRKFLGIWIRSKVDELYLGINKVLLKYTYKEPEIKFDPISTYGFTSNKIPIYMYNQTYYAKQTDYAGHNFYEIAIEITKNNIPFFEFDDVEILNIYIPNIPLIKEYKLDLTTGDIYSQSNLKKLYEMGIDFLKTKIGSKKDFVITHQKTPTEIEVIYFGEQHHEKNTGIMKRYFYKDVGFVFGTTIKDYNPDPDKKYDADYVFKPVEDYFRTYTYYDLDFYAVGKRNGTWKGNRMVRNDNN